MKWKKLCDHDFEIYFHQHFGFHMFQLNWQFVRRDILIELKSMSFWTQLNEKLLRLLLRIEMYFKLWKLVMKLRLMHSDFLCFWLNSAGWLILLKYLKYINYTRLFIYNYLFDKAFDIHTDISVAFCGQFVRIGVSVLYCWLLNGNRTHWIHVKCI